MHVALIAKPGHADTGVGRYAIELERTLQALGHQVTVVHPSLSIPDWLAVAIDRVTSFDVQAFCENYPVWARYPKADIYHITSQNLATLMIFRRPPGKTVITVHDIIPWLVRRDPTQRIYRHALDAIFDRLALWGIKRADAVLTDSRFTAACLSDAIDLSRVPVETVMLGVARAARTDPAPDDRVEAVDARTSV